MKNNERHYKIMMKSWGGTRYLYMECLTYQEAFDICENNAWVVCPNGGYLWDLVIEEM